MCHFTCHPSPINYFGKKKISKINILQWVGLPHSIPDFLKGDYTSPPLASPSFLIHNNIFDVTKKKSKDYYLLFVTEKVQHPNIIHEWKSDFNLSDDNLREFFLLPHSVALGLKLRISSIKCFTIYSIQIKNYSKSVSEQTMFVLFVRPNQKLFTISFANALTQGDSGTIFSLILAFYQINRFVFRCRMLYLVSYLSNAHQPNKLLLIKFIIIGKLFLWDCRTNQT